MGNSNQSHVALYFYQDVFCLYDYVTFVFMEYVRFFTFLKKEFFSQNGMYPLDMEILQRCREMLHVTEQLLTFIQVYSKLEKSECLP